MPLPAAEKLLLAGNVMYWDRQQWRPRWCCLKKASHSGVQLFLYTSKPTDGRALPSELHSLADFCGLDGGQTLEGEVDVLSVITAHFSYTLALPSRSDLERWTRILEKELGGEWMFPVNVLPGNTKIQAGEATLRFFPTFFSLTSGNPSVCLGFWMHNQIREFGGQTGFSFVAGSSSYGGEGYYRLDCKDGPRIVDLFNRVVNGRKLPRPPPYFVQMPERMAVSTPQLTVGEQLSSTSSAAFVKRHSRASSGDSACLYTPPPGSIQTFRGPLSPQHIASAASGDSTAVEKPELPPRSEGQRDSGTGYRRRLRSSSKPPATPPPQLQSSKALDYILVAPGLSPADVLAGRTTSQTEFLPPAKPASSVTYSQVSKNKTKSIANALNEWRRSRRKSDSRQE